VKALGLGSAGVALHDRRVVVGMQPASEVQQTPNICEHVTAQNLSPWTP
jgi:hypothetical protein